jgi:predicted RNase H-like HicB family nuclease
MKVRYHSDVGTGWVATQEDKGKPQAIQAPEQTRARNPGRSSERRPSTGHSQQRSEAGRAEAMKFVVVYEKSASGWGAYVPDLPGVIATGHTKEGTRQLIREAIEFHLEGLREDNIPIPEPSASTEVVSVS